MLCQPLGTLSTIQFFLSSLSSWHWDITIPLMKLIKCLLTHINCVYWWDSLWSFHTHSMLWSDRTRFFHFPSFIPFLTSRSPCYTRSSFPDWEGTCDTCFSVWSFSLNPTSLSSTHILHMTGLTFHCSCIFLPCVSLPHFANPITQAGSWLTLHPW